MYKRFIVAKNRVDIKYYSIFVLRLTISFNLTI